MTPLPHTISFQAGMWSGEYGVEFRLIYYGQVKSDGNTDDKHTIRKQLHQQLKQLWEQHSGLRELSSKGRSQKAKHRREPQSTLLNTKGAAYRLLYLIGKEHGISCELDILFLRRESPGGLYEHRGDLDNRLKTIFDALKTPRCTKELPNAAPAPDEDPFFCLLEDDRYVEKFTVTTDRLLTPLVSDTQKEKGNVLLVVGVKTVVFDVKKADWWQAQR